MGLNNRVNLPWTTVATDSTSEVFIPATGWMSSESVGSGRGWLELRGAMSGLSVAVAIETANDVTTPDTPHVKIQALVAANGVSDPDSTTTTLTTAGQKFIRVGFAVKASSASLRVGRVSGVAELFDA